MSASLSSFASGTSVKRALTAASASGESWGAEISGYELCFFDLSFEVADLALGLVGDAFSFSFPLMIPRMLVMTVDLELFVFADEKNAERDEVEPSALMLSFEEALLR